MAGRTKWRDLKLYVIFITLLKNFHLCLILVKKKKNKKTNLFLDVLRSRKEYINHGKLNYYFNIFTIYTYFYGDHPRFPYLD